MSGPPGADASNSGEEEKQRHQPRATEEQCMTGTRAENGRRTHVAKRRRWAKETGLRIGHAMRQRSRASSAQQQHMREQEHHMHGTRSSSNTHMTNSRCRDLQIPSQIQSCSGRTLTFRALRRSHIVSTLCKPRQNTNNQDDMHRLMQRIHPFTAAH